MDRLPQRLGPAPEKEHAQTPVGLALGGNLLPGDDPVIQPGQGLKGVLGEGHNCPFVGQDALVAVVQVAVKLVIDLVIAGRLQKVGDPAKALLRPVQQGDDEAVDGIAVPPGVILQGVGGGVVLHGDSVPVLHRLLHQGVNRAVQLHLQQESEQSVLVERLVKAAPIQQGAAEQIGLKQ